MKIFQFSKPGQRAMLVGSAFLGPFLFSNAFVARGMQHYTLPVPLPIEPVQVGGFPGRDPCPIMADIDPAIAADDATNAVRDKHARDGRIIGKLRASQTVLVCSYDRMTDQWAGIVYDAYANPADRTPLVKRCRLDRPIAVQRTYVGPCTYGWVPADILLPVNH